MSTDVHEGEATIQQRKDEKLRVPMYGWMIEKDDERYLFDLGMLRVSCICLDLKLCIWAEMMLNEYTLGRNKTPRGSSEDYQSIWSRHS